MVVKQCMNVEDYYRIYNIFGKSSIWYTLKFRAIEIEMREEQTVY